MTDAHNGTETAENHAAETLDRALAHLPPDQRWQEWMRRIEAVLFASAVPVARKNLERVVGPGVSVDLLIADLHTVLAERPYDIAGVGDGWILRTRPAYAAAIRAAAHVATQGVELRSFDAAVLTAIAYRQPVTREALKEIFGRDISRDLIGRLHERGLITTGPRSPRRGAPYTYVTTERFLVTFGLKTLRDLPDTEALEDAGLLGWGRP